MKCLPPLLQNLSYDEKLRITVENLTIRTTVKLGVYGIFFRWWGERDPTVLRPTYQRTDYSIVKSVFKTYLDLCQVLEFTVFNIDNREIVGGAFLLDVGRILDEPRHELKVIDHSGSVIGVMTVKFDLSKKCSNANLTSEVQHNKRQAEKFATNIHPQVYKKLCAKERCPSKPNIYAKEVDRLKFGIAASLSRRKGTVRFPGKNCTQISSLTGRYEGSEKINHKLTESANIENTKISSLTTTDSGERLLIDDLPTLISFLLGKSLSGREERKALVLLNKMSPNQNFIEKMTENCLSMNHQREYKRKFGEAILPSSNIKYSPTSLSPDILKPVRTLKRNQNLSNELYNLQNPVELAYFNKFIASKSQ